MVWYCIVLYRIVLYCIVLYCIVLYCIVSIHLYSASYSAHESEALPVLENQREESSITSSHITFSVQLWGNSVFNYLLTLIFYFSFHLLINQEVVSQQTTWSDRVWPLSIRTFPSCPSSPSSLSSPYLSSSPSSPTPSTGLVLAPSQLRHRQPPSMTTPVAGRRCQRTTTGAALPPLYWPLLSLEGTLNTTITSSMALRWTNNALSGHHP